MNTYWPNGSENHGSRNAEIPIDLTEWSSSTTLIQEVYGAIYSVEWPAPAKPSPGSCPEAVLRTVVVYCFSTGLFGAKEIEAAASHDPVVKYLCARNFPRWEQIREFRRRNALFIKKSLALVFRSTYRKQLELEEANYAYLSMGRFSHSSRPDFDQVAEDRLKRAIQADSMAMDF